MPTTPLSITPRTTACTSRAAQIMAAAPQACQLTTGTAHTSPLPKSLVESSIALDSRLFRQPAAASQAGASTQAMPATSSATSPPATPPPATPPPSTPPSAHPPPATALSLLAPHAVYIESGDPDAPSRLVPQRFLKPLADVAPAPEAASVASPALTTPNAPAAFQRVQDSTPAMSTHSEGTVVPVGRLVLPDLVPRHAL